MPDEHNPLDALTSTPADGEVQPDAGQGPPPADPSAVQPEGQGQPDAQTGLYDLSTVPEEYRSEVERIAKDIDRNVNAKLQEAAEFRKNWEPFEQHGLKDADPEGIAALLEFAERLSDPDAARDALVNLAESLEIDLTPEAAPAADGGDDPVAALQAKYDALEARLAAQDDERKYATAYEQQLEEVREEFAEVEAQHGKSFSDQEKTRLIGLAKRFQATDDHPIKAAYSFINEIAGGAEAALVEGQPTQPKPAERGGRASTTVKPVDTFEEAERIHRERMSSVHS